MYESHFWVQEQEKEADLFDDLSQFIKAFKQIMSLSSEIMERLEQ
jgi:hypothetical protein